MSNFSKVLTKYRQNAYSERDKGARFETLIKGYLCTAPYYADRFKKIWLWNEFPYRADLGGRDSGIDLVAETTSGDFWAIQCKCYTEDSYIDKAAVDSFLSTSSRTFANGELKTVGFSNRLFVSTTNHWSSEAENAIRNQNPPVNRISLYDLEAESIDWEKLDQKIYGKNARNDKKQLRPHQQEAISNAREYFKNNDRGKLIMACGTGKTFTSLKLVEQETQDRGTILFLVPSIALLGQTLREWSYEANDNINAICICSDAGVSKTQKKDDDGIGFSVEDLALPATTDIKNIVGQLNSARLNTKGMTVVFSTYQSIDVISAAQKRINDFVFDFIVCDEAHRTTGITVKGEDDSAFVKVHDNDFIKAKKRLYMTATPRLYKEDAKQKAKEAEAFLCSMDDPAIYGEEIYRIGFGKAVDKNLLSDYKVLILTISDKEVTPILKKIQDASDNPKEISTDDVSKLVGCINALSKRMLIDKGMLKESDPNPMHRAVAFCQNIKISKKIANLMNIGKDDFYNTLSPEVRAETVSIEADHVDGSMSAPIREQKLAWLKSTPENGMDCRILTNVRCLSEGVDVPTLDAVLFLSARNSQIDVVQSVGRVMRSAPNKKYGYIIIPILVPPDVKPEDALDDNERYKVVWTVLNALRAHDDRFDAYINKIELNKKKQSGGGRILIGGGGLPNTPTGEPIIPEELPPQQGTLLLEYDQLKDAIYARMVLKVGNKHYWEQWAKDIGEINDRIVRRIREAIKKGKGAQEFKRFVNSLRKNINPSVSDEAATEMLSQHIITRPVFEALFENYSFAKSNPVSQSMQKMLEILDGEYLDADLQKMEGFYESVKMTVSGIDNIAGKQKIIVDLYDKFFKTALPKTVEKLGIVYTPIEVVDFILHSVEDVLQKEFQRSMSDENVNILDPFTGTGTFISRLITSGIIKPKDLLRKYSKELHANEIVLLAYYIASINIENAFHDTRKDSTNYQSFEGICLTDTFQLGESDGSDELELGMFPENSKRVRSQKKQPLRIIIGNPPYSVGQKAANDNAQNQSYPALEARIAETYASLGKAVNKNSLYDSYIKAFRWATDRLDPKNGGIIAFVSNGNWIDGNAMDGFRKCIEKEFSVIYVFNLRGNQRTSNELSRREGGKIFGQGSRTPIAITILVKNPKHIGNAKIHYHDIGDYLSREEKLEKIKKFGSVLNPEMELSSITPNEDGDWINKRSKVFETYIPIEPDSKFNTNSKSVFTVNTRGFETSRDVWSYNFSKHDLSHNIQTTIKFFNSQVADFQEALAKDSNLKLKDFITFDSTKISWSSSLFPHITKGNKANFEENKILIAQYRPFFKQYVYAGEKFVHRRGQFSQIFPTPQSKNLVICVPGIGSNKDFSTIIVDVIPDIQLQFNGQCFPLYWYEKREDNGQKTLFDSDENEYIRRDGISDFILERCRQEFGYKTTKEDIFYYVYGLFHSKQYRSKFEADLKKTLPRIPLVKDFWTFSKVGKKLADLHLNYEELPPPDGLIIEGADTNKFVVDKMRFHAKGERNTIIYNSYITIKNIPNECYSYCVNGKSPIEWLMERYQNSTDEKSKIVNDPNKWSIEHNNPKYIFKLLLSSITLSLRTLEYVKQLPDIGNELI